MTDDKTRQYYPTFQQIDWSQIDTARIDRAIRQALASVQIPEGTNIQDVFRWWVQTCFNSDHVEEFADSFVQWAVVDEWLTYRDQKVQRETVEATIETLRWKA
jgi:hypothetical protein